MRILLAAVTTTLLAGLSTVALADTADVQKMNTDDCARARKANKTCVLTIDDDGAIDGKVPVAGESTITIPIGGKLNSLIRIRREFIVEILRSAENID
ncbi:MAG: hypothetical protein ABI867_26965 [Kofleriaceae bacterium]